MQAIRSVALGDEISHARLDHWTAARLHGFDLPRAKVNADYVMPLVRQAGRRDRADIAEPEYADRSAHTYPLILLP